MWVVGRFESVIPANAGIHPQPVDERTEGVAKTFTGIGTMPCPNVNVAHYQRVSWLDGEGRTA